MKDLLLVGTGGFVGSVLRYGVSVGTAHWVHPSAKWPWATFAVNVFGSFLIGLLAGWIDRGGLSAQAHLLLAVGLCGGFTTFSTFSLETLKLLKDGQMWPAAAYMVVSLIMCVGGVWAGWSLFLKRGDFITI